MTYMKFLSARGLRMPSSPIRCLEPYAVRAAKEGKQVYYLNIGQPDIKTPEAFMNSIKKLDMEVLPYGPSAGLRTLRQKMKIYYRRFDIDVDTEDIIVTNGGSEAIIFAMMAVADPGDEIIIPEPFYTNYNGFAVEAGIKMVPVTSKLENNFQLPPIESVYKKITSRTRAILICNPNNPTGYVYPLEELEALRQIILRNDLFIMSDEAYREFVYDGQTHISILHLAGIEDRAIVFDSISKRYSACGARIGMLVCKNRQVTDAALRFGMARLCPPTIEQIGTEAAIDTPDFYLHDVIAEYTERRNVMVAALHQMPGVIAPLPKGAFYLIAKLPVDNAHSFAQWLLSDFDIDAETVMIAPANGFYCSPGSGDNQVRLAYVLNVNAIKKAMNILAEGLKSYPGRTA